MGLFDKKFCDICGEKIGMLGNRKLDDGNLCKECAKKLSPWFEERRHSTVASIKEQLAYREANKEKVRAFQITRDLKGESRYHVYLDDNKRQFAVASAMNLDVNPDILDLSQVTSCRLEVKQNRKEEQYRDKDGNLKDYNPPRYTYTYDYWIRLAVSSPWFDDMDFQLNSFSIDDQERAKMMNMESVGGQIVAALTGNAYSQPMGGMQGNAMYGQPMGGMQGNAMYGQPMGGMQGNAMYGQQMGGMQGNTMYGQKMNGMQGNAMYGQQMNGMQGNNMYGQQMNGMQGNNMYGQQMNGMQGNAMYGQQMNGMQMNQGMPQGGQTAGAAMGMAGAMAGAVAGGMNGYQQRQTVRCDKCGWVPEDPNNIPRFCPECGDPIDGNDMR